MHSIIALLSNLKFNQDGALNSLISWVLLPINNWRLSAFRFSLFRFGPESSVSLCCALTLWPFLLLLLQLPTSPSLILADFCRCLLGLAEGWTKALMRLMNGNTMKKELAFTPILTFGVLSFLLLGRSATANHSHALISLRVRGWNFVSRGTPS